MNFRKAVLFLAAVAIASYASASAQLGVYGMFTADELSNIASSPLPLPPNSSGSAFSELEFGGSAGRDGRGLLGFYEVGAGKAWGRRAGKHPDHQAWSLH